MNFIARFYFEKQLTGKDNIVLTDDLHLRASKVLRLKPGEKMKLFNPASGEFIATIDHITKHETHLAHFISIPHLPKSSLHLHLGQALTKKDRMDFIVQKTTELGISEITPLLTERIQIKYNASLIEKRLQHWQNIAISAAEQCGRIDIPLIHPPCALKKWLEQNQFQQGFICDFEENKTPRTARNTINKTALLIGPESGLAKTESMLAKENYHFHSLSLGPRILRAETAAITATSLLQYKYGDLN